MPDYQIILGESVQTLSTFPDACFDSVVTDPPYAEVKRDYGRWTEEERLHLMKALTEQVRRVLKPSGSAVMILQPNSEHVGRMRTWLWEFMAWAGRYWNIVQDVYWWNPSSPPTVHSQRKNGLLRPSVKPCVWLGEPDCFKSQDDILWKASDAMAAVSREDRSTHRFPSGQTMNKARVAAVADQRGGVTPFNLIPISTTNSVSSGGAHGHGATTPLALCSWWVRYLTPVGGIVLDPFAGSATVGLAALAHGCDFIGIEKEPNYVHMARQRLAQRLEAA